MHAVITIIQRHVVVVLLQFPAGACCHRPGKGADMGAVFGGSSSTVFGSSVGPVPSSPA